MARTVAIEIQGLGDLIRKKYFYIDKTSFIRKWWESGDSVTVITRPCRFGKRMFNSMLRGCFRCTDADYNDFIKAMPQDDIEAMNAYMNRVALTTFSYFDTGRNVRGGAGALLSWLCV